MAGLVEKIELNCDMGEGFGRWKMVRQSSFLSKALY
jgi:lactam utilization protein B